MKSPIFGGASTFSKMYCNYPESYPSWVDESGCDNVFDDRNNMLFDTVSGLGSRLTSFGSCSGGAMSYPTKYEVGLALELRRLFPFIEMVRYGCNGADATEGAIRYARAYTGRTAVYSCGYHSCQSAFSINTPPAIGCIYGCVRQFDYIDQIIDTLSEINSSDRRELPAAVIVEPVQLDIHVKTDLSNLRKVTKEKGVVLVFDEIITGFRVPTRSISTMYGIYPDIVLLGKALGDGYPLSVIGGSAEIMDRAVFHSYTFAGLPAALKNGIKVCQIPANEFNSFWLAAEKFFNDFNSLYGDIRLKGYATRGVWDGPEEKKYIFWQEMLKKGFFLGPVFFPRMCWSQDFYTLLLSACKEVLGRLPDCNLEGRYPQPIFKRN